MVDQSAGAVVADPELRDAEDLRIRVRLAHRIRGIVIRCHPPVEIAPRFGMNIAGRARGDCSALSPRAAPCPRGASVPGHARSPRSVTAPGGRCAGAPDSLVPNR